MVPYDIVFRRNPRYSYDEDAEPSSGILREPGPNDRRRPPKPSPRRVSFAFERAPWNSPPSRRTLSDLTEDSSSTSRQRRRRPASHRRAERVFQVFDDRAAESDSDSDTSSAPRRYHHDPVPSWREDGAYDSSKAQRRRSRHDRSPSPSRYRPGSSSRRGGQGDRRYERRSSDHRRERRKGKHSSRHRRKHRDDEYEPRHHRYRYDELSDEHDKRRSRRHSSSKRRGRSRHHRPIVTFF